MTTTGGSSAGAGATGAGSAGGSAGGRTKVAVLLVAGVGSRLRPLTEDRPKALVQVGGESILARAVRLLAQVGVEELVVATGYRADAVASALASCGLRVTYRHNPAYDRTQNAVSLAACADAVGERGFFKLDGDVLFRAEVLARLDACAAPLAAAVDARAPLGAEEMKVLVSDGRITRFSKGLDPAASAGESIGIERVDGAAARALFDALAESVRRGETDVYYEDVYNRLVAGGLDARAVPVSDLPWTEVDTPEDLARAHALVASGALDGRS